MGTAVGSTALSQCQVFVIANSVKPYQPETGTGPGGGADYSKWNFRTDLQIYYDQKSGPDNKITAKYICSNNPSAVSYYSVNVTEELHQHQQVLPIIILVHRQQQRLSQNNKGSQ